MNSDHEPPIPISSLWILIKNIRKNEKKKLLSMIHNTVYYPTFTD